MNTAIPTHSLSIASCTHSSVPHPLTHPFTLSPSPPATTPKYTKGPTHSLQVHQLLQLPDIPNHFHQKPTPLSLSPHAQTPMYISTYPIHPLNHKPLSLSCIPMYTSTPTHLPPAPTPMYTLTYIIHPLNQKPSYLACISMYTSTPTHPKSVTSCTHSHTQATTHSSAHRAEEGWGQASL